MNKIFYYLISILSLYACSEKEQILDSAKEYTISAKKQLKDSANIIFYADLSKTTNDYRFFVLNLKDSTILNKGLCLNGRSDEKGKVIFSNIIGSNCSSKGVYKIGNQYNGNFGKAFKLHGLDKTNSNAEVRHVVLHSYYGVPKNPTVFNFMLNSEGCPTVNPEYLEELAFYIKKYNVKYLIIN